MKLLIIGLLFICQFTVVAGRTRLNFDFDWQFRLGENGNYTNIQLPHDWSITLDFDRKARAASGYLPGGIGWYRKEFTVPQTDRGKRISIIFDGIYHKASIFPLIREKHKSLYSLAENLELYKFKLPLKVFRNKQ